MRKIKAAVAACALVSGLLPVVAHATSGILAGVGIADATWHVGVGSGQYTRKSPNALNLASGGDIDPHNHSNVQRPSYGVHSRLSYRALVVEGSNGKRVALVKSDAYLAQDMLARRVAQILAQGESAIGYDQILLAASHNHSSPYYTTPAWGVWLFQDVFEIRAFEYHARQMAAAIEAAAANLRPARIGATTVRHTIYKGQIAGQGIADDGTPRGYPETRHKCAPGAVSPHECEGVDGHGDFDVTVMRVDEIGRGEPKPLAVWVNHGQHPESLDGYDLITADFLAPLERMVERDTGATLIFSQGDVGSAEGPYFRYNAQTRTTSNERLPDGVLRAWAHVGHAQTERGARYLADSIVEGWHSIGHDGRSVRVPFSSDFPVEYSSRFFPLPTSHPYPSVSNCRTETTAEGSPGSPILGLPDCERASGADRSNMLWENLKEHGLPLPEHYDAPSFTSVEENMRLRLQVFRLGDIVLGSCACEAQMDIILNFESRADDVTGNIFDGYDWSRYCSQNADTTWTCERPSTTTFSDARYRRMMAQIHNDAKGWDAPENAVAANAEPANPAKIWGNFTKEELSPSLGYKLAVGVGHATDYNGYTVSYREYMAYDHYRKALTCCGPHTADYMSTRMVRMAGALKGGAPVAEEILDPMNAADEARQTAFAAALGAASGAAYDAWLASLPNDVGPAAPLEQPKDIERFDATTFTWRGGSNAVDNPWAWIEREVAPGAWERYADQTGEVQTRVTFPRGAQGGANTHAGRQEWKWTANFEAYDGFPGAYQTPAGRYRFVVEGSMRTDGITSPYRIVSHPFTVSRFTGLQAVDKRVEDGDVSFTLAYPRTYLSVFPYIRDDGNPLLCKTCSFRPWASSASVPGSVAVRVERVEGAVDVVVAEYSAGRWTADTNLRPGDVASIPAGTVTDSFGETNAAITF